MPSQILWKSQNTPVKDQKFAGAPRNVWKLKFKVQVTPMSNEKIILKLN